MIFAPHESIQRAVVLPNESKNCNYQFQYVQKSRLINVDFRVGMKQHILELKGAQVGGTNIIFCQIDLYHGCREHTIFEFISVDFWIRFRQFFYIRKLFNSSFQWDVSHFHLKSIQFCGF